MVELHFRAVVLVDSPSRESLRVELRAATSDDARALLEDRFGADSIVELLCIEDAERLR